jgi:hypothetical protein
MEIIYEHNFILKKNQFFLLNYQIIAIKQDFWNKKIVFCVIGNEIRFGIFPKILFYDYITAVTFSISVPFLLKYCENHQE